MTAAVSGSLLRAKYATAVDRESAREKLAARLDKGAEAARQEPAPTDDHVAYPQPPAPRRAPKGSTGSGGDVVSDIMCSPVARDLMRTAAREIVRGVFGVGRRRR